MSLQCVYVPTLVAKIYFQTDIFSELRLQRSKHSSNCAMIIRATRHAGTGIVFNTRSYCSTRG